MAESVKRLVNVSVSNRSAESAANVSTQQKDVTELRKDFNEPTASI